MISINELILYLNKLFSPENFEDYCPNGLQVEGCYNINKIITGVTACQALLDKAVEEGADAVLVHHGYFWKNETPCVVGIKKNRLMSLLNHNINLIAYHLPLDAHPVYGNNVQLAKLLNIEINPVIKPPVFSGRLKKSINGNDFARRIQKALNRAPFYIPGKSNVIESVAWCSGGAQDYIEEAISLHVDAYITGEVSERTVHIARESGIHFFAAGHHATERYGIKSLGEHLSEKFQLSHLFIDIDNPI